MGKNQHVASLDEHLWAVLGASNSRNTSLHPRPPKPKLVCDSKQYIVMLYVTMV